MTYRVWPGRPFPLGATYDGSGTNFSIFSEHADKVWLCLFDDAGKETRVELTEIDAHCHHGYLPEVRAGQRYAFRVSGPWDPAQGLRFNEHNLLLDPYAKAIDGSVTHEPAVFGHRLGAPEELNTDDSAPYVPRCVVIDPFFDWSREARPHRPLHETVIYELHVKGFTARHPRIPPDLRGTYAGLAHPEAIDHLLRLGVTAVELMPVHEFVHDGHLLARGLRNYWGYNTIGYFAPHHEYAGERGRGRQVQEFKHMVRTLHAAGIEVILDVVYNHTAEGNHDGPTLCFRGVDNLAYYRLVPDDPFHYFDTTGTGNSLNMRSPHVLHLLMDSLRYWVLEMHVDGFRFDLAATLARELHEVDRLAVFFDLIQQDPIVSQVKLIAEPWDLGEGGYQVGNFPPVWSEWNGLYRDTVRDYWRGADSTLGDFANRLTGSADLYSADSRRPLASVNFVTAHDGFTLRDLVSYNDKHNDANGEENRDGENHNRSWNCGVEGETDDREILELRERQQRNLLTTLFLSQGVPMLLMGDEMSRSQRGNNNAYCQDNELSWLDWSLEEESASLLEFSRKLIAFRTTHPVFHRRRWFHGRAIRGTPDIGWFRPDGEMMTDADWNSDFARAIGVFLNGDSIATPDDFGRRIVDDSFLLLFNAHYEPIEWRIPDWCSGPWQLAIDTERGFVESSQPVAGPVRVGDRSIAVLLRKRSARRARESIV